MHINKSRLKNKDQMMDVHKWRSFVSKLGSFELLRLEDIYYNEYTIIRSTFLFWKKNKVISSVACNLYVNRAKHREMDHETILVEFRVPSTLSKPLGYVTAVSHKSDRTSIEFFNVRNIAVANVNVKTIINEVYIEVEEIPAVYISSREQIRRLQILNSHGYEHKKNDSILF